MTDPTRLVVVSNRLPIALEGQGDDLTITPGKGGLVTALAPVLRNRGGLWIGWSGATGDPDLGALMRDFSRDAGYDLHTVPLSAEDVRGFYQGFSNEVIWPLFHDFQSRCNFQPEYFRTYLAVNERFAEVIARHSVETDYIWVHDYHLMHVAAKLKERGCARKAGFFLHIPFPTPDIFLKLPWRMQIIKALAEFDLVGFHTQNDRRNFLKCMTTLVKGAKASGRGPVITVTLEDGRELQVGYFPISIDFKDFSRQARTRGAAKLASQIRQALKRRTIILGADRLDYSKGIPQRFEAMRSLLRRYPDLQNRISLLQIVVPSREKLPEYQAQKMEIESLVGDINGEFSVPGYVPIQYLYRNLNRDELVGYYRAADMALVTPLRDGMNLVAKEYCACNITEDGVLILSEFAGAAAQLQRGAFLVNPYDVEGVADTIHRVYHMDRDMKRAYMRKLRALVRKYDIFWWVNAFLESAFGRQLTDFTPVASVDYIADRQ